MSRKTKKDSANDESKELVSSLAREASNLLMDFAEDEDTEAAATDAEVAEAEAAADEAATEHEIENEMHAAAESENADFDVEAEPTEVEAEPADVEAEASETLALEGTELDDFEAASIEDVEVLTDEQVLSIIESALFSTDKPMSLAGLKTLFKGTNIRAKEIRAAIATMQNNCLALTCGYQVVDVAGGYQLRTKPENMKYLRQTVKARPFKLSGPALEVMSICAYKQPVTKAQIDEIRGVESGHLLRALMEKHLITFGERSELPGKPMFYETTRKFLEIFGLRNIQELPSLSEIDQLIPEGIGDVEEKETLSDLTGKLSQEVGSTYSEGEDELLKISDELQNITTSSEFFEEEKRRQREKRDNDRAQDLREALAVGEEIATADQRWLDRHEAAKLAATQGEAEVAFVTSEEEPAVDINAETVSATEIESVEAVTELEALLDHDGPREPNSQV